MELGNCIEFYVAVAAVTVSLLAGVSGLPPKDNVLVEVKLEKELHIVSRNSSAATNENETVTQPFECVINGLSEDELSLFSSGKSQNVIVSTKNGNISNIQDKLYEEEGSQPFNVEINVVNDTLVVRGDILMMRKTENGELEKAKESDEVVTSCEVLFLDTEDSSEGSNENVTSRSGYSEVSPPVITTRYDHVVLMNGAPEQVISCAARGNPSPRIGWILQGHNKSNVEVLSKDSNSSGPTEEKVSYLLFSQVDKTTRNNYTCVAENELGKATKTFEIDVISVEAINPRCNDVTDDDSPHSRNQAIIFRQNIHEILRRSKRHLWYQWRTTKLYDPPYSGHPHSGEGNNSNLQKMVNFIAERLKLADKVAVHKWDNDLPVEDIPREQIILENVVRQAQNRGIDPDWATRFFRDQIEANKDVQFELLREWQIRGRRPLGPPVDLANEVRPEIDYINEKLLELAKYTENERRGWRCKEDVEKNARYAAFVYNLSLMHQRALQRATESLCITPRFSGGDRPPYPFHPYPPPPINDFPPF